MHWSTRQQRRDPGEAPGADTVSPVVALRGASKRYRWDGPLVLRDVSVEVAAGALVKVRGVNGSGKSTLLRLLAGATVPTRGRRVAARSIAVGYSPERLAPPPRSPPPATSNITPGCEGVRQQSASAACSPSPSGLR